MTLPNFQIIGAARSGTSALARFLDQHPDVFVCNPKETHFAAFAEKRVLFEGPGDNITINKAAVTDPKRYERLFRGRSETARGEGSVSTMYYHEQSIANLKKYTPDARLIAVLRNPVERAYSSFLYMVARGFEPLADFELALDQEERRIADNWQHIWHYTRVGMYCSQVAAFQKAFPADQLRIVLFEDLASDDLFENLFEFLGVESSFRPDTSASVNRSGIPRNRAWHWCIKRLDRLPLAREIVKTVLPRRLLDWLRNANLQRPPMSESARKRLEALYRDEIENLQDLLDRDLSAWLTDSDSALQTGDSSTQSSAVA